MTTGCGWEGACGGGLLEALRVLSAGVFGAAVVDALCVLLLLAKAEILCRLFLEGRN